MSFKCEKIIIKYNKNKCFLKFEENTLGNY